MIKKLIKLLWPYLEPYKKLAIASFLLSFVLAGLTGAQVKLIKPIFDKGLSGNAPLNEILFLAGALLLIGILNYPARFYHFYWLRFIGEKITCNMRTSMFEKMQRLPTSFYNHNKQGTYERLIQPDKLYRVILLCKDHGV